MSSRRLAFCSAAAGALWIAWPSLLPSHPPCRAWSCHTPRITRPQARWPSPRDDLSTDALKRWHALHELHVGQARARGSDLVFLGDSITEGWLRTGFSSLRESLPQPECEAVWQRAFKQWQPLNFGIGGDRAQDLGWRIQHGLLPASLDPRVIVLLIGTNDIGKGEDPQVALTEVRSTPPWRRLASLSHDLARCLTTYHAVRSYELSLCLTSCHPPHVLQRHVTTCHPFSHSKA